MAVPPPLPLLLHASPSLPVCLSGCLPVANEVSSKGRPLLPPITHFDSLDKLSLALRGNDRLFDVVMAVEGEGGRESGREGEGGRGCEGQVFCVGGVMSG